MKKRINVTQPYLPPLEELTHYLEDIWESKCLTNNGPYHQEFEKELAKYLDVPYVSLFTNATIALVTALQTLRITGEVITSPYSFVATTHALNWNGIKPVFVDIEKNTCNIDAKKIESAISSKTTAILPVHVYGNPSEVEEIQQIADIYGLKVIYDAAHAFGVKIKNNSILNYGDLSILSFHATKSFNTFEGGAIISHDIKTKRRIDFLKNFGFANETTVVAPGINGKMNEFQAAMGLIQLKYYDQVLSRRREIFNQYTKKLSGLKGIRLFRYKTDINTNYSYFPIFIENSFKKTRDELYEFLKKHNIYGRRYFYPLISSYPMYRDLDSSGKDNLPVATEVSNQVICLPIYPDLSNEDLSKVCSVIKSN